MIFCQKNTEYQNVTIVLSLAQPNGIAADHLSNRNRLKKMSACFVIYGLLPLVVISALGIIRFLHLFRQFQLDNIKTLFCFVPENIQLLLSRLWEKLFYLGFTDSIRALLVSFILLLYMYIILSYWYTHNYCFLQKCMPWMSRLIDLGRNMCCLSALCGFMHSKQGLSFWII